MMPRRRVLAASLAGLAAGAAIRRASAAAERADAAPRTPFVANATGDGVVCPWGEARIRTAASRATPTHIVAAGGLAVLDFTGAAAHARLGDAARQPVLFSSAGAHIDGRERVPWSPAAIDALLAAVESDLQKARGIMLLRATLHTAFPVAAQRAARPLSAALAATLARDAPALGADAGAACSAATARESLVQSLAATVDAWRAADDAREACRAGVSGAACAAPDAAIDAAVATVLLLAAEVGRRVAVCAQPPIGYWPSPWDLASLDLEQTPRRPSQAFTARDRDAARNLLAAFEGALWPSTRRLLRAQWSFLPLASPLQRRDGTTLQPYAVRVRLPQAYAREMAQGGFADEHPAAWRSALALLAGLSVDFAAFAAPLGIAAAPETRAALARAGGVATPWASCAALQLAFAMLTAYFGEGLAAQMAMRTQASDDLTGPLWLEHASFAVAMIAFTMRGSAAGEPIPPIVVGRTGTELGAAMAERSTT